MHHCTCSIGTHITARGRVSRRMMAGVTALWLTLWTGMAGAATATATEIQELVAQGKLDQALVATDVALKSAGSDLTLRFLKGLILTRLNQLDQAARMFESLTRDYPDLPEPYNNLAVVYAAKGDFERAQDALRRAINTHPSYATAHENMGDIYAKMASQAYNQALELDDANVTAKAKLALISDLFSLPPPQQIVAAVPDPSPPTPASAVSGAETEGVNTVAKVSSGPLPVAADPVAAPLTQQGPAATAGEPAPVRPAAIPPTVGEKLIAATPAPAMTGPATAVPEVATAPTAVPVTTAPEVATATPATDDKSAVLRAVDLWATAWSSKDVDAYLSLYSMQFSPPGGQTRAQWAESRRLRLTRPKFISIELADVRVTMHGADHAQATFQQRYKSDTFNDSVAKTLIWKLEDSRWTIAEEVGS